jgi:hypothetical protein
MAHGNKDPQKDKLSTEFKARLDRLGPQQKVRAIVMLHGKDTGKTPARRQSSAERQAAIESVRKSAEQALVDIDRILECFDGQRLAKSPDALGSISVETTAAGITALASCGHVKAILEDQPISLLAGSKR